MHLTSTSNTYKSLCNLPLGQADCLGGGRAKPFFEFSWLSPSFMCTEKIYPYLMENCFTVGSWDHPKGLCHQACNGLHGYQQTASATSGGSSHSGTAVFSGADTAFGCFVSHAYPRRAINYFITWVAIIKT